MNGWWRIGVVIATLIAIPAGGVGFENSQKSHLWGTRPSPETLAIKDQQLQTNAIWKEFSSSPKLSDCVLSEVVITDDYPVGDGKFDIDCENNLTASLGGAIQYAVIPYAILLLFGATVTWIYRGFRPKAK